MSIEQVRLALFAIVGVIVILYLNKRGVLSGPTKIQLVLASAFGAFCGIGAGISLSLFIQEFLPVVYQKEDQVKIYSLRDMSRIEGKFLLGTGWIGQEEYYTYYYQNQSGMKKGRVPVENSSITEGVDQPVLITYRRRYAEDWYQYLGGPIYQSANGKDLRRYELHVPAGTVMSKFSLE